MSSKPRRIAVCADDFGIDAGASEAILQLLVKERLHSTSVLVFGTAVAQFAPRLREQLKPHQSVGLHFTLTEATADYADSSLVDVALRSYLRLMSTERLRTCLQSQLNRFEDFFGFAPHYVDGHEHVHQFPAVRQVLVDTLLERYGSGVALRCTRPKQPRGFKAKVIASLGGSGLQSLAERKGIRVNSDFAGVYALQRPGYYRRHMQGWLSSIADDGLIMCHPCTGVGRYSAAISRREEFAYFNSTQWHEDMARHAVQVVAFR